MSGWLGGFADSVTVDDAWAPGVCFAAYSDRTAVLQKLYMMFGCRLPEPQDFELSSSLRACL